MHWRHILHKLETLEDELLELHARSWLNQVQKNPGGELCPTAHEIQEFAFAAVKIIRAQEKARDAILALAETANKR